MFSAVRSFHRIICLFIGDSVAGHRDDQSFLLKYSYYESEVLKSRLIQIRLSVIEITDVSFGDIDADLITG